MQKCPSSENILAKNVRRIKILDLQQNIKTIFYQNLLNKSIHILVCIILNRKLIYLSNIFYSKKINWGIFYRYGNILKGQFLQTTVTILNIFLSSHLIQFIRNDTCIIKTWIFRRKFNKNH